MIEADAQGHNPFEYLDKIELSNRKLFREEVEMYGRIIEDVGDIMEDYFNHWPEDSLVYLPRKNRYAEHEFAVEIDDGILCKGKFDAFGEARGLHWLVEHKSFTRQPSEDHRWRNIQSSIYQRINQMLDWFPCDGIMWDYIRSKPPTHPKPLKSGKFSTKNVDTLVSTVRRTAKELGLPVPRELLAAAKNNRDKYFIRVFTPSNEEVTDTLFREFVDTSREMSELHGKSKTRNIGRHCEFCDFEGLCRAEMLGHDVDFVKEREYTTEKEEDEKIDSSDEA